PFGGNPSRLVVPIIAFSLCPLCLCGKPFGGVRRVVSLLHIIMEIVHSTRRVCTRFPGKDECVPELELRRQAVCMPSFMHYRALLISISLMLLFGGPGWAQTPVKMLPPKPGSLANLVPVPIPSATCAALGETAGCLAFGHDRLYPHANV